MRPISAMLLAALLLLPSSSRADVVVLVDGTRVEGRLVEVTEKGVKIKTTRAMQFFSPEKVREVFRGDVKIENPCPACKAGGFVTCNLCNGSKKAPGHCQACKGDGHGVCPKCAGTKKFRCEVCGGSGKRIVLVPTRGLSGWKKKAVNCKRCKGYGWYYCSKCKRKGYVRCKTCRGSGAGPCPACKTTGKVVCPLCGGVGEKKMAGEFLDRPYEKIRKTLQKKMSEALKKKTLEDLVGKVVFWPAIVVRTDEKDGGCRALLNLDRSNVRKSTHEKGWEKASYVGDLRATFRPSQAEAFASLEKNSRLWVLGVLFLSEKGKLVLIRAEIVKPPNEGD